VPPSCDGSRFILSPQDAFFPSPAVHNFWKFLLRHAGQPIAAGPQSGQIKTAPVLSHGNSQLLISRFHLDENLRRARMAGGIVERLLEYEENPVAPMRFKRCHWKWFR